MSAYVEAASIDNREFCARRGYRDLGQLHRHLSGCAAPFYPLWRSGLDDR
ncbi:hypothetical protein WEI85_05880 [Actinomycetes bacterium KLBMP 9797]